MPSTSERILSPIPSTSPTEFFDSESKTKVVQQCVDNLISPEKLAIMYKCVPRTIRTWVKKSGQSLPEKYTNNVHELETYTSSIPATNIEVVLTVISINLQSLPFLYNYLHPFTIRFIHSQSFTIIPIHLQSYSFIHNQPRSFTIISLHSQWFTFIYNHCHSFTIIKIH